MFTRPQVKADGTVVNCPRGSGLFGMLQPVALAADSNQTLTVAQMAGGMILRSGQTAGRTDTTPTAELILAANPGMDIGDSFLLVVSNVAAQTLTLAGGTDVTLGTKTTIAASSVGFVLFTKTGAATMSATIL